MNACFKAKSYFSCQPSWDRCIYSAASGVLCHRTSKNGGSLNFNTQGIIYLLNNKAAATSTWQEHKMNATFFPCSENDREGPLQVDFTSATRQETHRLSRRPTITRKDAPRKMLNFQLSRKRSVLAACPAHQTNKHFKRANTAFIKCCFSPPFMLHSVPECSSTPATAQIFFGVQVTQPKAVFDR